MKKWFTHYGPTLLLVALIVGGGLWAGFLNGWN